MIELQEYATELSQTYIWISFLIFLRVGAVMALLPAFGEQVTPMRVKLVAAIAFTVVVAPLIWNRVDSTYLGFAWSTLIIVEIVAGLSIGAFFRLIFISLQIAGTVAAQSMSLSQMFGGGLGAEPQPAVSTLLMVSGLCLAVMMGLHIRVIEAFLLSYKVFAPGVYINPSDLSQWGITEVSASFGLGLTLAGSFILASLVYNLALGAINRSMPQLMVAFVGAPAISFGGLVLLFLTAPIILSTWILTFLDSRNLFSGSI